MRIALARAVYSSAEMFVFDDILARMLKGKTVLLATHHTKYLPHFDTAIAMEEDGRIRKIGVAEEFKGTVKEMVVMESIDIEADSVSLSSVLWYFKHASFFLLFLALLAIVLSNVAQNGQCAVLNMWTVKDAQMEQMNRTLNGLGGEKRWEEEKEREGNLNETLNES
ncbi:uncharacterized protein MONOS_17126 [Monocercomonoides exilis]|uniref:uncharacterized protein n=1 Tax=Monocercomonoides exilis TaxID=2049356 RepID=UPI00355AAF03|nr:hypothetical protein MONOS_17126 [Monocercomonoides exilis]